MYYKNITLIIMKHSRRFRKLSAFFRKFDAKILHRSRRRFYKKRLKSYSNLIDLS